MQNPLSTYEAAIAALDTADEREGLEHKHKAVLALTRAGSLDFALSEYFRYGLGEIRHHEDIMGLGGRLYKDLYLSHTGDGAQEYARLSAEKYEAAYKDTGGFYSGINAATMSLLGGISKDIVEMRAQRILEILDKTTGKNDNEVYFMEATRAEAYLLLGQISASQQAFRRARDYDPLNFTAHASTIKQFRMIGKVLDESLLWLSEFVPPRAVHFAGHIFGQEGEVKNLPALNETQEQALFDQLSNIIQVNDIGFAYGALAAGADILIAEAVLDEGGELHVILPISQETFVKASVAPFGKSWVKRFDKAMLAASSVTILDNLEGWPDHMLQHRASVIAMGGAIRKSEELSVEPGQLLLWDGKAGPYGTAHDASIWGKSGRGQYILPYPGTRNAKPHAPSTSGYKYRAKLVQSHGSEEADRTQFDDLKKAVQVAINARIGSKDLSQTIIYDLSVSSSSDCIELARESHVLPGGIIVCELAANYLTVYHSQDYLIDYMGLDPAARRIFALRERG